MVLLGMWMLFLLVFVVCFESVTMITRLPYGVRSCWTLQETKDEVLRVQG